MNPDVLALFLEKKKVIFNPITEKNYKSNKTCCLSAII